MTEMVTPFPPPLNLRGHKFAALLVSPAIRMKEYTFTAVEQDEDEATRNRRLTAEFFIPIMPGLHFFKTEERRDRFISARNKAGEVEIAFAVQYT